MSTKEELKKLYEENKIVFGSNEILRQLRQDKLSKVIIASNLPKYLEEDIRHNASISDIEVEQLNVPGDELALTFKRHHSILSVGVLKE